MRIINKGGHLNVPAKPRTEKTRSRKNRSRTASHAGTVLQKERTHRQITRGTAVESVSPLMKVLGEVEFFSLMERIFSMPEIKGMVMEAVNAHNVAEQSGGD